MKRILSIQIIGALSTSTPILGSLCVVIASIKPVTSPGSVAHLSNHTLSFFPCQEARIIFTFFCNPQERQPNTLSSSKSMRQVSLCLAKRSHRLQKRTASTEAPNQPIWNVSRGKVISISSTSSGSFIIPNFFLYVNPSSNMR